MSIILFKNGYSKEIEYPQIEFVGDSIVYNYILEDVVFYDNKVESSIRNQTITERSISIKQPLNVAEAIKDNADISITTGSKGESSTKIRGFSSKDILVLVDGRPVNPGYYGKVDLAMLPSDNIAQIKIIKGPASVAYGTNNTGGVINIITKNGQEKPLTKIHGEFGNYYFNKIQFSHSQQLKNRFNYWITGYKQSRDGYKMSGDYKPTILEDGGLRDNSSYDKWGVNSKIGYKSYNNSVYSLSLGYHYAKKNVPSGVFRYLDNRYFRFPKWFRYHGSLAAYWILSKNIDLKGTISFDSYQDRLKSYLNNDYEEDELLFDSILENYTAGTTWSGSYMINPYHELSFGLNSMKYYLGKKPDTKEPWLYRNIHISTIYSEYLNRSLPKLTITGGISLNMYYKNENNILDNYPAYSLLLDYKAPYQIGLNGGISITQRFPTLHNLYSISYGNPELKPEESIKYEIGMNREFSFNNFPCKFGIETSFFYNDLKNKIDKQNNNVKLYHNINKAQIGGYDINVSSEFYNLITIDFGYAFLKPYHYGIEMMYDSPKHKINSSLTLNYHDLTILYSYNYCHDRETEYPSKILPSYHLHKINVAYKILSNLEVQLKIQNIFDIDYEEEIGYPSAGRFITGGFTFSL